MTDTTVNDTVRNGVDTAALFATLEAVDGQRELAKFQFRVRNNWISGTHNRSTFGGFFGAGTEHEHKATYTADADHPPVLIGADNAPTGAEYVLHALAACITHAIANSAAARKVNLTEVTSTVTGDVDLQGVLGLSDEVRKGYNNIRISFDISGDADEETLRDIVEQGRRRSAVYDVLTNGVNVDLDVNAG
ncbi:MAG TPA: OsmC family protein [Euzebyales bacterium]